LEALFTPIFDALDVCKDLAGMSASGGGDAGEKGSKSGKGGKPSSKVAAVSKGGKNPVVASTDEGAEAIQELDEDELQEFIEEHDLEVDLDDYSTLKKKRAAVAEAYEEATENAAGDDAPDFSSMDEEELEEFITEHDLEVDLDDIKGLKKQRAAVEKAYQSSTSGTTADDEWD
jgi:hypothetical protein